MKPIGKGLAAIALVAALAWLAGRADLDPGAGVEVPPDGLPESSRAAGGGVDGGAAQAAFEQRAQGRMVRVAGQVVRILADDRDGSPHQRFVIATDRDQSLLVAHNLDLAPRLEGLAVGDRVVVYGEYEWNTQGGVMHWTHDDPKGTHPAGYIDWRGSRYQ